MKRSDEHKKKKHRLLVRLSRKFIYYKPFPIAAEERQIEYEMRQLFRIGEINRRETREAETDLDIIFSHRAFPVVVLVRESTEFYLYIFAAGVGLLFFSVFHSSSMLTTTRLNALVRASSFAEFTQCKCKLFGVSFHHARWCRTAVQRHVAPLLPCDVGEGTYPFTELQHFGRRFGTSGLVILITVVFHPWLTNLQVVLWTRLGVNKTLADSFFLETLFLKILFSSFPRN